MDRRVSNPVFNDRKLKLGTFQTNLDSGCVMSDLDGRLKISWPNTVALAQLATAMHDPWIAGSGDGEYQLEARGAAAPELFAIRSGTLAFHLQGGTLNHIMVDGSPLKWHTFSGTLNLAEGVFNLTDGRLEAPSASYGVAGKATWSRTLDFKLTAGRAPDLSITGTLAAPRVSS